MRGKYISLFSASLISGILIGRLSFIIPLYAIFPILFAAALFIFSWIGTQNHPFRNFNFLNSLSACLLFCGIGLFASSVSKPDNTSFSKGDYYFSGLVRDFTSTNSGDKLLLELSSLYQKDDSGNYISVNVRNVKALMTLEDASEVGYGCHITGFAALQPIDYPSNFRNDDYIDYLRQQGIYLTGFTNLSKCKYSGPSLSFYSFFLNLRDFLEAKIESVPLSVDSKNFLISVLLGDKSYISSEQRLNFSDAGIAHIFAVSGLHVSLVSMFLLALMSPLFCFGRIRRWKFLVCIPAVWFYIFLVGFSAATCRAGIMLTLAFIAIFLQRRYNALNALGWAVILILSFMPGALFDIGFQLSVVCVGSLILIAGRLNFVDHRSHPRLFFLVSMLLVALTASFSTWILCAFYFHRFSLMFLPLNLIAVPLLPVYIGVAAIYLFLFYLGFNVEFLGSLISHSYDLLSQCTHFFNSISGTFDNIHPGITSVVLWIVGLISLCFLLNKQKFNFKFLPIPLLFFGLSIMSVILMPASSPEGFILPKSLSQDVAVYHKGREFTVSLPEGDAVATSVIGKNIMVIRSSELSEETLRQLPSSDFVLICKGCNELPENLEVFLSPDCKIVTHPSIHWRHEKKIIDEAGKKFLNFHSLRYDGPLHVFED